MFGLCSDPTVLAPCPLWHRPFQSIQHNGSITPLPTAIPAGRPSSWPAFSDSGPTSSPALWYVPFYARVLEASKNSIQVGKLTIPFIPPMHLKLSSARSPSPIAWKKSSCQPTVLPSTPTGTNPYGTCTQRRRNFESHCQSPGGSKHPRGRKNCSERIDQHTCCSRAKESLGSPSQCS